MKWLVTVLKRCALHLSGSRAPRVIMSFHRISDLEQPADHTCIWMDLEKVFNKIKVHACSTVSGKRLQVPTARHHKYNDYVFQPIYRPSNRLPSSLQSISQSSTRPCNIGKSEVDESWWLLVAQSKYNLGDAPTNLGSNSTTLHSKGRQNAAYKLWHKWSVSYLSHKVPLSHLNKWPGKTVWQLHLQ